MKEKILIVDSTEIPTGKNLARRFIQGEDIDPKTGKYVITDPVASLIVAAWNKVKERVKKR